MAALTKGNISHIAVFAETQVIRKQYRYAVPILDWSLERLPEAKLADFYYLRGFSLMKLYAFEEALSDMSELLRLAKIHKGTKYKAVNVKVDAAVCALWLDKLDEARDWPKAAPSQRRTSVVSPSLAVSSSHEARKARPSKSSKTR